MRFFFKKQFFLAGTIVLFIFTLSPFATSCSSVPQNYSVPVGTTLENSGLFPEEINWTKITDGFEEISHKVKNLKVSWTCVKIDLNTENLEFEMEPDEISEIYKTKKLKQFAKENKTIISVNTTPFDNVTNTFAPIGILINNQTLISMSVKRNDYAAIGFYKDIHNNFRADLLCPQSTYLVSSKKYDYVIGGFFQILKDGNISTFESIRRSRTACGIDSEGRFLYIFAATPDFSLNDQNGLTYEECAFILKNLGCNDALQFDGGHSTGLCIYTKEVQKPFFQRKVPAFLGIKTN